MSLPGITTADQQYHARLSGISKRYSRDVLALQNISLDIYRGEIFGIIGRSGAGKSTLLRLFNCLETPDSGTVTIDGEDTGQYNTGQLRGLRRRAAMIFQHFNLMATKTVAQNVELPLRMAGVPQARRQQLVSETLKLVGLEHYQHSWPARLSGGQKQRVGIARALVMSPEILLCDEATSALDPENTQSILALLRDINQRLGLTIILITHEMNVIRTLCDRVAVLEKGQIIEQGEVWRVFGDPSHPVTRKMLGSLHPDRLEDGNRPCPDKQILVLRYTGHHAPGPQLHAIASALGDGARLLYSSCEQIQGRTVGQFRVQVDAAGAENLSRQLSQIADHVEVIRP